LEMNDLTVEGMLQIGHGCGLKTLDEAYGNVIRHYDVFFPVQNFSEARDAFNKKLIDAGLTEETPDGRELLNISIKDAADKIGFKLEDI